MHEVNYRVKNHRGKLSAPKNLWIEYGDTALFLKRLRVDNYQHPITGEPISLTERTLYKAYYGTLIDE